MLVRLKLIVYLVLGLMNFGACAVILSTEQAQEANVDLLQDEATVFQTIGIGINLSLLQCSEVVACPFYVADEEIQEFISVLDSRITMLESRSEQDTDVSAESESAEFDDVLAVYMRERDNYIAYRAEAQSLFDEQFYLQQRIETEPTIEDLLQLYEEDLAFFEDEELVDDEFDDEFDEELDEMPLDTEENTQVPSDSNP